MKMLVQIFLAERGVQANSKAAARAHKATSFLLPFGAKTKKLRISGRKQKRLQPLPVFPRRRGVPLN